MRKLFLVFAVLPLFLFNNCSDNGDNLVNYTEERETKAIAQKLQKFIDENRPQLATVYTYNVQENRWENYISCGGVRVEDPFIYVCQNYYNLSYLVQFRMGGSGLELFFKINN